MYCIPMEMYTLLIYDETYNGLYIACIYINKYRYSVQCVVL